MPLSSRPMASAALQPKVCSAARFQSVTRPSIPSAMKASLELSRMTRVRRCSATSWTSSGRTWISRAEEPSTTSTTSAATSALARSRNGEYKVSTLLLMTTPSP